MAWSIVGVVGLMALFALAGFFITRSSQIGLLEARHVNQRIALMHRALVDAETGVRGFLLTGRPDYLEPYQAGSKTIDELAPELRPLLDAFGQKLAGGDNPQFFTARMTALREIWDKAITQAGAQNTSGAIATLETMQAKKLMDQLRGVLDGITAARDKQADATAEQIRAERTWLLVANLIGAVVAIAGMVYAFDRSIRDGARRDHAVRESTEARNQIERLFVMTDMLQSASEREDANDVLRATAIKLLPGLAGALYVFNNSRDRLDLSTSWSDMPDGEALHMHPDHVAPAHCWALKRGKPHFNLEGLGELRCAHAMPGQISMEIPMAARGELYGLLEIIAVGEGAGEHLAKSQQIAGALADAMSLALSNISLRERLRNQALRDPLTGLYNRRFLEEMLERLTQEAERKQSALSMVMIDLDHFKLLNDQFGHTTGDAVLRQASNTILSCLSASDVACRYGGEELALLLPDCTLKQAVAKAETIREAIVEMSKDGRLPAVTASFGVATTPDTAPRASELVPTADAALYQAKQQGRNCVVASAYRGAMPKLVVGE